MPYAAKILADSISPAGVRITTKEITYPRMVHAEFLTHRLFSRNSASSRAIPAVTMRRNVVADPAMPVFWGANQKGMQATEEIDPEVGRDWWLRGLALMEKHHAEGEALGIHKQLVNRVIETWMNITVIVTATDWDNWWHLRCEAQAQPEIRRIAEMMKALYDESKPLPLKVGEWHRPLTDFNDIVEASEWVDQKFHYTAENGDLRVPKVEERLNAISVGRCARVSFLTHDGKRDQQADVDLHNRLVKSGHWSPFEHVATPLADPTWRSGNFTGWMQYRKTFPTEHAGRERRKP